MQFANQNGVTKASRLKRSSANTHTHTQRFVTEAEAAEEAGPVVAALAIGVAAFRQQKRLRPQYVSNPFAYFEARDEAILRQGNQWNLGLHVLRHEIWHCHTGLIGIAQNM